MNTGNQNPRTSGQGVVKNTQSPAPVAWRRQEAGIWVYYETKAWDDLEPLYTAAPHPSPAPQAAGADDLRDLGLTVAVHNDYHLNGQAFTFWLLTDTVAGKFYKGEGKTDAEALDKIRAAITASGRDAS